MVYQGRQQGKLLLGVDALIDQKPHMVVIQAGVNDLVVAGLSSRIPAEVAKKAVCENLSKIVAGFTAVGTQVMLLSIGPTASPSLLRGWLYWDSEINSYIHELNNHCLKGLANVAGVEFVSLDMVFLKDDGRVDEGLFKDALHFKPAAYEKINNLLLKH